VSSSPFDHPLLGGLLGDEETAALFTADAELLQMTVFESALAIAEAAEGVIPAEAGAAIAGKLQSFVPDVAALRAGAARDGVVVPELVRQMRVQVGETHAAFVHFGATSQDVIDTSLVLRLQSLFAVFERRLEGLVGVLAQLAAAQGGATLMGRTRMQEALPITAAARIDSWSQPLARHVVRLDELKPRLLLLQFGGPVGTLEALGVKGEAVARRLAQALGLGLPRRSWHSQRDGLAELASWLSLVTGTLGKFGQDIALMAQMGEIGLEGGGGSSAMPHKQNPVQAEVLVALARYNAVLVSAMQQAAVHEQERSGAGWSLEWLALPQMAMATGAALRTGLELAGAIRSMGAAHG
jgi:3-carboxy-cis,cis-muconate cycloisomerase